MRGLTLPEDNYELEESAAGADRTKQFGSKRRKPRDWVYAHLRRTILIKGRVIPKKNIR